MAEFLPGVVTADNYDAGTPPATLGPAPNVAAITFSVFNYPALATFYRQLPDQPGKAVLDGVERLFYANSVGVQVRKVAGVKFRSAIAGKPSRILAELDYTSDPEIVTPGSIAPSTIFSGGQSIATAPGTPTDTSPYLLISDSNADTLPPISETMHTFNDGHLYLMTACSFDGYASNTDTANGSSITASLTLSRGLDDSGTPAVLAATKMFVPAGVGAVAGNGIVSMQPPALPLLLQSGGGSNPNNLLTLTVSQSGATAADVTFAGTLTATLVLIS